MPRSWVWQKAPCLLHSDRRSHKWNREKRPLTERTHRLPRRQNLPLRFAWNSPQVSIRPKTVVDNSERQTHRSEHLQKISSERLKRSSDRVASLTRSRRKSAFKHRNYPGTLREISKSCLSRFRNAAGGHQFSDHKPESSVSEWKLQGSSTEHHLQPSATAKGNTCQRRKQTD